MDKGKKIKLDQRTKAESDPAVAAASILARAGFLFALKKMVSFVRRFLDHSVIGNAIVENTRTRAIKV